MKRIFTFLLASIFTLGLVNAQTNLVVNGGFEEWTSETEPTGEWKKKENLEKEATEKHSGEFSAKQTGGTKDIQQIISGIEAGAEYTLTLWYKVVESDGTDARIWSKWMTGDAYDSDTNKDVLQGPANAYFPNNGGVWTKYETTVTAPAAADGFSFEVRTYGSAVTYWDDFSFVKVEASADKVATPTFSPDAGLAIPITFVKIACETEGASIMFTTDGTDPEAPSLTNPTGSGLPYGVAGVSDSIPLNPLVTKHTVKAIAYKVGMDNSSISSVMYQYPVLVGDIATLRSKDPADGDIYAMQTSFILTMQQDFRNQKFIQDATGAILVDDASGVNLNNFKIGDEITGIGGKLTEFGGMLQLTLENTLYATNVHDKPITPTEITITDLTTNFEMYESQLVTIKGVTFSAADGTAVFENGSVYDITDGANTGIFRTTFYNVDYIGDVVPQGKFNITGILNSRSDGNFISARMKTDLVLDRTGVDGIDESVAKVYSIPNALVVEPTQISNIVVYNLSGKVISQLQSISGRVELPISKGIVLVKISNGLQSQTAKVLIK